MPTSRIPAAVDALIAICQAQAVVGGLLENVTVFDGPSPADDSMQLQLFIGGDPDEPDAPAVTGGQEFATLPGRERNEQFSIMCCAIAWSGETTVKTERDRAFAIKAAVERAIRPLEPGATVDLNGAVDWAQVGEVRHSQWQTTGGATAKVVFYVDCQARI